MTESAETAVAPVADRMAAARAARAAKKAAEISTAETAVAPATSVPVNLAVSTPADAVTDRAATQRAVSEAAAEPVHAGVSPTNNARVANKLAAEDNARERAARQRLASGLAPPQPNVQVRITKAGDGRVSMGAHVAGIGEAHYEWKEEATFPQDIALALEDRGFVEIL